MEASSGTRTFLSRIARRTRALPSNVAIIEENRILHQRAGMHADSASQHGVAHDSPDRMLPPATIESIAWPRRPC